MRVLRVQFATVCARAVNAHYFVAACAMRLQIVTVCFEYAKKLYMLTVYACKV